MSSPRGDVYYSPDNLLTALPDERQQMLGQIVDGMLARDMRAGKTAYRVAKVLGGIQDKDFCSHLSFQTDTSHGNFDPLVTLSFLHDTERLHGFINAVKRWPAQEGVLDVGSGPFPILALATALFHPKAEIQAIEINQRSAETAEEVVEQFGLGDRIKVINTDVTYHQIDANTTAAVTETFNSGLQDEPGPKIVKLLHDANVPTITPSTAKLRLKIAGRRFYQTLDLRRDTHANIAFDGSGHRIQHHGLPDISAAYYDAQGVVVPFNADVISRGLTGQPKLELKKAFDRHGYAGNLSYELGCHPFEPIVEQTLAEVASL